jgi:UDP-N-acetylglucosamine--N-acetylmuramyl-(pentapeptide) pyrophosphoryl-undecaprenol N-acetylglucosamine transferase
VVFSKGSFVSVPVGIAARLRHVPIITHDSDTTAGLANRVVGRWAAIHAVGQPEHYYDYPKDTLRYVGIPLDSRIKPVGRRAQLAFKAHLKFPAGSLVLLVAGGGLGSEQLNHLLSEILPGLLESITNLEVVLITGDKHRARVSNDLVALRHSDRLRVIGFTPNFFIYSGAADLVITRAGATALAELELQAKACIVIPSPFLPGGHQLQNVKELAAAGAIEVVNNNVEPQKLLKLTRDLLLNQQRRATLGAKLGTYARPHAADELASIILSLAATGSAN